MITGKYITTIRTTPVYSYNRKLSNGQIDSTLKFERNSSPNENLGVADSEFGYGSSKYISIPKPLTDNKYYHLAIANDERFYTTSDVGNNDENENKNGIGDEQGDEKGTGFGIGGLHLFGDLGNLFAIIALILLLLILTKQK